MQTLERKNVKRSSNTPPPAPVPPPAPLPASSPTPTPAPALLPTLLPAPTPPPAPSEQQPAIVQPVPQYTGIHAFTNLAKLYNDDIKFTGDLHDVQSYYQDDSTFVNTPEEYGKDPIKPNDYYLDHELEHHNNDTFYTDRRYNQNRNQRNDYRRENQNDYRRENQNDYRHWNQNRRPIQNQNRKCFVYRKQYCWSTRYPPEERKRIKWQKENTARGLNYIQLNLEEPKLFTFVDASFANNKDMSSQIGYIIVLGNEITENNSDTFKIRGNIIH